MVPGTHGVSSLVGLGVCLYALEKSELPCLCRESNYVSSVVQSVLSLYAGCPVPVHERQTEHLFSYCCQISVFRPGLQNPGREFFRATKFCTVAPNICWSSLWNQAYVAHLTLRNLTWFVEFCKIWAPLVWVSFVAFGFRNFSTCIKLPNLVTLLVNLLILFIYLFNDTVNVVPHTVKWWDNAVQRTGREAVVVKLEEVSGHLVDRRRKKRAEFYPR